MGAMYTQRAGHCPWAAFCTMRSRANSAHAVLPDPVGAATRQLSSVLYRALNTCSAARRGQGMCTSWVRMLCAGSEMLVQNDGDWELWGRRGGGASCCGAGKGTSLELAGMRQLPGLLHALTAPGDACSAVLLSAETRSAW